MFLPVLPGILASASMMIASIRKQIRRHNQNSWIRENTMTDKETAKTLSVRFALPVDTTANAFPDQALSNGLRKAGFVAEPDIGSGPRSSEITWSIANLLGTTVEASKFGPIFVESSDKFHCVETISGWIRCHLQRANCKDHSSHTGRAMLRRRNPITFGTTDAYAIINTFCVIVLGCEVGSHEPHECHHDAPNRIESPTDFGPIQISIQFAKQALDVSDKQRNWTIIFHSFLFAEFAVERVLDCDQRI
jgi:hypothetical protein